MRLFEPRVACVGIGVVDYIYNVPHLPAGDTKIRATATAISGGGMAAGAAVAAARLGANVEWYGRLGEDAIGTEILERISSFGVSVEHVRQLANATSPHSIVLVSPSGERIIVGYGAGALEEDASWLPVDNFRDCDAVLADVRWLQGAKVALEAARHNGVPAILDADSSTSDGAAALMAHATHVIFSLQGLKDLMGESDPEAGLRAAARQAPFVAVTRGADGVSWLDRDGHLRHHRALKVDAVETLGAGDVFHGAFSYALAQHMTDEEALRFATVAAGLKSARVGGWIGYPNADEVRAVLA